MLRIRIDEHLRERWTPVVLRYFQMMLATSAGGVRSIVVQLSTERSIATGECWVCELRGRRYDGGVLHIRSAHADAEIAIGHAFARARRELMRRSLRERATAE